MAHRDLASGIHVRNAPKKTDMPCPTRVPPRGYRWERIDAKGG